MGAASRSTTLPRVKRSALTMERASARARPYSTRRKVVRSITWRWSPCSPGEARGLRQGDRRHDGPAIGPGGDGSPARVRPARARRCGGRVTGTPSHREVARLEEADPGEHAARGCAGSDSAGSTPARSPQCMVALQPRTGTTVAQIQSLAARPEREFAEGQPVRHRHVVGADEGTVLRQRHGPHRPHGAIGFGRSRTATPTPAVAYSSAGRAAWWSRCRTGRPARRRARRPDLPGPPAADGGRSRRGCGSAAR